MIDVRLIDGDALKNRLTALVRGGTNLNYCIADMIDRAITIEPERKRGKWIETKDSEWSGGGCYKCSHCSLGISFELFGLMTEWNYCPNCGADMRKEGDHE